MAQDCCSRQALLWVDFLYCQFLGVFCFRLQSKFRFPALSVSSRPSHFFLQFQFLFVHFLASVLRSITRVHRQNLLAAQCDSGVCQQHSPRIVKHRCQSVRAQVFHQLSGYVLASSPVDDDDAHDVDYVGVLDRNSSLLFETTSIDALTRLPLLSFRAVDRQELFQKELFLMNSQKQCWDSKNDILCTWAEF